MRKLVEVINGNLTSVSYIGKVELEHIYKTLNVELFEAVRIPQTNIFILCDEEGLLGDLEGKLVNIVQDVKTGFETKLVGNIMFVDGESEDFKGLTKEQFKYMFDNISVRSGVLKRK